MAKKTRPRAYLKKRLKAVSKEKTMPSTVHFAGVRARNPRDNKINKIKRLFDSAGFEGLVRPGDLVAVKLHFGEPGCDTFLKPVFVRAVVDKVRECGGVPFLTDTNTLYRGQRFNGAEHAAAAVKQGFAYAVVDAPVLIADGLRGENTVDVPVKGKRFTQVKVAGAVAQADALIVLSHFKGHEAAGFGGAIKNLAMGCSPAAGKQEQHCVRYEVKEDVCTACGRCLTVCPVGAIHMEDRHAVIDKTRCMGCSACYAACPAKAIDIDWRTKLSEFMERMTEYALGPLQGKKGKAGFMNFLLDVTPDCDCLPWSDRPIAPDVGILAGTDPVAMDRASFDLVNAQAALPDSHIWRNEGAGGDKFTGAWGHTLGETQLTYGETVGLGVNAYELVEV